MTSLRLVVLFAVLVFLVPASPVVWASDDDNPVDLVVSQTDDPDPVFEQHFVTYAVTVMNRGPRPANVVQVTDDVDKGSIQSASGQKWSCLIQAGSTTCRHHGALPTGKSTAPLLVVVQAPAVGAAGAEIFNTIVAETIGQPDTDESSNTDTEQTTVAASADLSVDQFDEPGDWVAGGQLVRYGVTAANGGDVAASGVTLSSTPSPGASVESAAGEGWTCTTTSGSATCSHTSSLAPGATASIDVYVRAPELSQVGEMSNTAAVSSDTGDSDPTNNRSTETTEVRPLSDGHARGVIPPEGGSITTCTGNPDATDHTCGTLEFPAGPGGVAEIIELPQHDLCTADPAVNCAGDMLELVFPEGYDDRANPIVAHLVYDASVAPADEDPRTIYVEKFIGAVAVVLVVPDCLGGNVVTPCLDDQVRATPDDPLDSVLHFQSGDPKTWG